MPLIETKGAASAQGFGEFAKTGVANYIEDVFSTYLYTGNSTSGGTQTITNSIDLSTKGGMVWIKGRSAASNHILTDTTRGAGASATDNNALASNLNSAGDLGGSSYDYLSSFSTTGFVVTQGGTTTATRGTNYDTVTYTSWTFRKQPKFFDVVTYTGTGANRTVAHNLGSVPGCIITKRTDTTGNWITYHRSLGNTDFVNLNGTAAASADSGAWNNTTPTSTEFSLGTGNTNVNGGTYVAYLFAHDAGGFGLTGADNVISCGSFTTDGSGNATVTLGYEPQFVIAKASSAIAEWKLLDTMRGWVATAAGNALIRPNTTAAEITGQSDIGSPTATGIAVSGLSASTTYIYITIRRGPMKTPTSGTSVFSPILSAASTGTKQTTNFVVDSQWQYLPGTAITDNTSFVDRLRKVSTNTTEGENVLYSSATTAETAKTNQTRYFDNTGFQIASNWAGSSTLYLNFRRAPGFFDVVCYTGTGSNTTQTHNLGVVPELIIVKRRDTTGAWDTYSAALSNTEYLVVNTTAAKATGTTRWNSTTPTSSVFSLGTSTTVNASGGTYVAYLFASCPGVSKVGSYTGTGTTKQIDCGFTGGARFVLIKRTDSTGDWYVWDSARGIVSGNDPYLLLNSTAAEVTNTDYVDTYSAGFEISSTAPAAINANGGTFIFLAIA